MTRARRTGAILSGALGLRVRELALRGKDDRWRLGPDGGRLAAPQPAADLDVLGEHVGADHQETGEDLCPDRLPVRIDLEPGAHPAGDAERRRVARDPAEVHEG